MDSAQAPPVQVEAEAAALVTELVGYAVPLAAAEADAGVLLHQLIPAMLAMLASQGQPLVLLLPAELIQLLLVVPAVKL